MVLGQVNSRIRVDWGVPVYSRDGNGWSAGCRPPEILRSAQCDQDTTAFYVLRYSMLWITRKSNRMIRNLFEGI